MANSGETTLALTGNTYLAQPVSGLRDERFLKVVEFLRNADASFTNMECTIQDGSDWPSYAAGMGWSATYMGGTSQMVEELQFLGVNAVCVANNHSADFAEAGILTTIRHLKAGGLPYTGIGASLTEAADACYYDTPTGKRVAFLAACDWGARGAMGLTFPWPHGYLPSDDAAPFKRRPGINLLRYGTVNYVSREALGHLRQVSADLGWEADKVMRREGFWRSHPLVGPVSNVGWEVDTDDEFFFMGRKFVAGDKPGSSTFAYQEDLDRIFKHIREARRQADIVVVALHDQSHGAGVHDYIDTFAHGAIDAGADVYLNNGGSHKGIEIYKGKAIIHGQPGLFLQTEAVTHVPSSEMPRYGVSPDGTAADFIDARAAAAARAVEASGGRAGIGGSQGSAVHVAVFNNNNELKEIRIQPLEPSKGPRFRSGLPLMPEPGSEISKQVLDFSVEVSKVFGTKVEVQDGMGVAKVK